MGQKSLAKRLYEQAKETHEEKEGSWLVLYDFKKERAGSKFYDNLRRLREMVTSSMIQYSAFMTPSFRGAVAVLRLTQHYGGEAVMYKTEEVNLER